MLKKCILIILLIFTYSAYSQVTIENYTENKNSDFSLPELKLKNSSKITFTEYSVRLKHPKKSDAPTGMFAGLIILTFINPVLVFEDKKIFWGLTKEISKSFYPYGRISFEYSYLFRTFNKNHFRFSYNYDHVFDNRSDWVIFAVSPGGGYFTDTENDGAFIQGAGGIFFPTPVFMGHLYLKYRFTKIFRKDKSDIHDISLGMGLVF